MVQQDPLLGLESARGVPWKCPTSSGESLVTAGARIDLEELSFSTYEFMSPPKKYTAVIP